MSFWYTGAKEKIAKGDLDWDEGVLDARALLVMSNTTADTDQDALTLSGIGTLFGATVAAGSRQAVGCVIYAHVDGTVANDWPIAFIDTGGFPVDGGGGPFQININAEGLLQVT
jgi:hypothetical protein